MTECLPNLGEITTAGGNNRWVEIEAGQGTTFMFGLFRTRDMAVARAFLSAGSTIEDHQHKEAEWLFVYSGEMELTILDKKQRYKKGDCCHIKPKLPHKAEFPVDTWLLAVTMPAAEGYPHAP